MLFIALSYHVHKIDAMCSYQLSVVSFQQSVRSRDREVAPIRKNQRTEKRKGQARGPALQSNQLL